MSEKKSAWGAAPKQDESKPADEKNFPGLNSNPSLVQQPAKAPPVQMPNIKWGPSDFDQNKKAPVNLVDINNNIGVKATIIDSYERPKAQNGIQKCWAAYKKSQDNAANALAGANYDRAWKEVSDAIFYRQDAYDWAINNANGFYNPSDPDGSKHGAFIKILKSDIEEPLRKILQGKYMTVDDWDKIERAKNLLVEQQAQD